MPFPSLHTRIEQARAFHGDDFALIAQKCGCTVAKVRAEVEAQDRAAAEDNPITEPVPPNIAAQQRRARVLAELQAAAALRRQRLLDDLERERRIVRANADYARMERHRAYDRGAQRLAYHCKRLIEGAA